MAACGWPAIAADHWAFIPPVVDVASSEIDNNVVDHFVAERLHREGNRISPAAPLEVLGRRLYLDLIGLPT